MAPRRPPAGRNSRCRPGANRKPPIRSPRRIAAQAIAADLRRRYNVAVDLGGSIGRRYRRQDEIGTPYCVTYDFDSQDDQKVTVRDRDSMEQVRISIDQLPTYLTERILGY